MDDGIIKIGSDAANQLGFTRDKFIGYLWKEGDRILIAAITSLQPRQGNFSKLISAIEAQGLKVAVSSPLGQMQDILKQKGFSPRLENDPGVGLVQVWMKYKGSKVI